MQLAWVLSSASRSESDECLVASAVFKTVVPAVAVGWCVRFAPSLPIYFPFENLRAIPHRFMEFSGCVKTAIGIKTSLGNP